MLLTLIKNCHYISIKKKKRQKKPAKQNRRLVCLKQLPLVLIQALKDGFPMVPYLRKSFFHVYYRCLIEKEFVMLLFPVTNLLFPLHIYFRKAVGTYL